MSHFTLGVVNVGGGECRGGECRTINLRALYIHVSDIISILFLIGICVHENGKYMYYVHETKPYIHFVSCFSFEEKNGILLITLCSLLLYQCMAYIGQSTY